jgi:hypothetical protein
VTRIDAHVHCFPDRLALAVRNQLNGSGQLAGGCLLPDLAEIVRGSSFDGAWVLPYAHRAGIAADVNEWSAREVPRHAGLIAGATFHPDDEDLPALCRRALGELGLRVVKLHCSVGKFSPGDARLRPLWAEAERLGVPVVVHAGQRGPGDTAPDEVDELVPVLRAHPALKLVLAHSGHAAVPRTLELMDTYANLYGDLTPVWAAPVPVSPEAIERLAGRFLFGSDAPNNPTSPSEQAARIEGMLSPATRELVMGATAARLVQETRS